MARAERIRVGVGGWTFPPWRDNFYPAGWPQKRELEYASRQLTTIEINGTYYGSQKPDSFRKWRDETPEDFVFAVKGPRFTTNRRVLAEAGDSIERFLASGVTELREKLGPINWQFPPNKTFAPDDFAAFLKLLPGERAGRPLRHAVEVRHESFVCPAFTQIARAAGVAIVRAGDAAFPEIDEATAPFVYARVMGTAEKHAAGYPPAAIQKWASRATAWAKTRAVFLYVISGHKPANPAAAMAILDLVRNPR